MSIQRRNSTGWWSTTSVDELFTMFAMFTSHLTLAIFLLNRSIYHRMFLYPTSFEADILDRYIQQFPTIANLIEMKSVGIFPDTSDVGLEFQIHTLVSPTYDFPLVHYPLSHSRLLMSNIIHPYMGISLSTSLNEHACRVLSARISPVPHTLAVLTQIQVVVPISGQLLFHSTSNRLEKAYFSPFVLTNALRSYRSLGSLEL